MRCPSRNCIVRPSPDLLRHVFDVDALSCPRCGARMRVLSAITDPEVARRILDSLRMPSRAPPLAAPTNGVDGRFEALAAELEWVDDPGFDFDESEPEPEPEPEPE